MEHQHPSKGIILSYYLRGRGEDEGKMLFFYMEIHFSSNCLAISTLLSQDDNKKSHTLSSIPGKSFPFLPPSKEKNNEFSWGIVEWRCHSAIDCRGLWLLKI